MADWKRALADVVTDLDELLEALDLNRTQLPPLPDTSPNFGLRVPWDFLRRIRPGDPQDPLLRQILTVTEEQRSVPGYQAEALDEPGFLRGPGLLHKYHGRALFLTTNACAVHCRYCFRRHAAVQADGSGRSEALQIVRADSSITEIILSGGDPLVLDDGPLAELLDELAAISHIRRIRLHTRLPVVIPSRITDDLVGALVRGPQAVVVIHANHANEIDQSVVEALAPLRRAGISLLNQAVLLAGVNDSADALCDLSEAVFRAGALPYYLHLLDPVAGTAHFEVNEQSGRALLNEVRSRLPGYLVPRLVREVPGERSKVMLG